MSRTFSNGNTVFLVKFNGQKSAPPDVDENENFWKLIGERGQVLSISPPDDIGQDRVLIAFDADLDELDLPNHNEISNSLWIKTSDLSLDE